MKNLIDIAIGYKNLVTGQQVELMKERLAICQPCPVRDNTDWCKRVNGGCGCKLAPFTSNPDTECIKGKWKKARSI